MFKWTPVKEKNPRFTGKYLVSTEREAVLVRTYDEDKGWLSNSNMTIIAWADLPDAYVSPEIKRKRRRSYSKYDGLELLKKS